MNQIKTLRLEKGLRQEDIAAQANISLKSYQRYERGDRIPNIKTALSIAKVLNKDVSSLWDFKICH